jgi:hypothetical protein
MELIVCFIDDSDFEHDLVREQIAPNAPEWEFLQTYTFEEAKERLGDRIPILFLLDLWGQDTDVKEPYITPFEELKEQESKFKTLEDVYQDLNNFQGDTNNEYLKRLFTIVDSWRHLFEYACDRIGQNRKYGLGNLEQVRQYYPGVPAVFYTRKSLINDAVAMIKAGTDGLFIKPTGSSDSETHTLTNEYAPQLIRELSQIIDSKLEIHMLLQSPLFPKNTETNGKLEALISSWKEFINK